MDNLCQLPAAEASESVYMRERIKWRARPLWFSQGIRDISGKTTVYSSLSSRLTIHFAQCYFVAVLQSEEIPMYFP